MNLHQLLASGGLVLDIAGAIWIVKGLLWVSDDELGNASDSSATWAGAAPTPRPELLRMFRESRRDARIGAGLLAAGFAGQLLAVWF
jgi:hypothetical protein